MSSPMSDHSDSPAPAPRRTQADSDEDASPPASPPSRSASKAVDDIFSDEDDDDVPPARTRRPQTPEGSDIQKGDEGSDLGDDLFGDGSDQDMDDAEPSRKVRTLDDEELDSGDDLGADTRRRKRDALDDVLSEEERDETSYEVDIGLHPLPKSSDDEVYILKIPQFISISPQIFKPETFQAPKLPPDAAITPYNYATTAIRWRKSPTVPNKLESNSRIIQWSDGTFSLQIGSAKDGLYDLPTNPLLPPKNEPYKAAYDSFNFLAEPLANSRLVRFFAHATRSMAVVPASDKIIGDDIKQLVAARYQAAQKKNFEADLKKIEVSYKIEDPEKARREAEAAEKEAERYRKKMEAQAQKQKEANANGYRRRFRRTGEVGGLTADDLEEGMETGKPQRYNRRERSGAGPGYRKQKDDEYDEDDGFVEKDPESDEEEEEEEDESDEEEEYRSKRKEKKSKKSSKASKRRAEEEEDDEDDEPEAEFTGGEESDAEPARPPKSPQKAKARSASEAEEDVDGEPSKAPERKRRRLIMDDSEEE